MHLKTALLGCAASLALALPAQAAIVGAVSATINSGGPGFGTLTETYNQAGLSANYVSGSTDFDSFVAGTTHTTTFGGFEWFGNLGTSAASVTYDLGVARAINKFALWNEESSGIGLLDLFVSTDGVTFSSLLSGLVPTDHGLSDYAADVFSFATTSFRYFRMDMSACPQPVVGSFQACAIGEVAFNETSLSPVPVPAAFPLLALALAGLGGAGALRRRKQAA